MFLELGNIYLKTLVCLVSRARSWFAMFVDDCSVDVPRLDIIPDL